MVYFRIFIQILFYLFLFYNFVFIGGFVVYDASIWLVLIIIFLNLLLYLLFHYLRKKTVRVYVVERSTKLNTLLLLKIFAPVVSVLSCLGVLYAMTEGNKIMGSSFMFIGSFSVVFFILLLKKWK